MASYFQARGVWDFVGFTVLRVLGAFRFFRDSRASTVQ